MSRVPGTFRNRPPAPERDRSAQALAVTQNLVEMGALVVEAWTLGDCSVICSRERYRGEFRWHFSIAHPTRYPTWDEVKTAAFAIPSMTLPEGHTFAQLFGNPRTSGQWVDAHPNCFHLYEVEDPTDEGNR